MTDIDSADAHIVRFGPFDFDLETLELRRAGRVRRLQQQPAKILRLLITRAGRLVTRAELQRHLWGDDTVVDFEVGLNAVIRKLRVTLGESRTSPRHIETIPRLGYRFRFIDPDSHRTGTIRSVAVLPFASATPDTEHVSDIVTESLVQTALEVPAMRRVVARNVLNRFRNDDPLQVGRRFNACAVLTGCVSLVRERIIVDVELLLSSDGRRLWGQRYDRALPELPTLLSEARAQLTAALMPLPRSRTTSTP